MKNVDRGTRLHLEMEKAEEERRKAYPQTGFKWYELVVGWIVVWFIILSMFGVTCARWTP